MSLLDKMKDAQDEAIVGFTEFLRSCKPASPIIYCFFEAKDDEIYYSNVISRQIGEHFETFKCRNKDGVLKVYGLIKSKALYSNTKTGFFIDRDFDPLINNPEIFETPFHSVENFYIHTSCITKVFHQQFGINMVNDEADFKLSLNKFETLLQEFNARIFNLNAWLSCHADERIKGNVLRLNIDDKIKWESIVNTSLDAIEIPDLTFEAISALFGTSQITKEAFEEKLVEFRKVYAPEVFRGKFQLQFLSSFLERFRNEVSKRNNHLCSKRYTTPLQFSLPVITTLLAAYAYVPPSLRMYITQIAA
jgi:hypothetical protein